MATDATAVRAVIAPALPDIDEPVLEYISTLVAEGDGGITRPLEDELLPFLTGESDDDDEAGRVLCARVEVLLWEAFGKETYCRGSSADTDKTLSAPVRIDEIMPCAHDELHELDKRPKSRIFSGEGGEAETYAEKRDRKAHDGVPLSCRKGVAATDGFGLTERGWRRPQKDYSCGMDAPLSVVNGALKVTVPVGASRCTDCDGPGNSCKKCGGTGSLKGGRKFTELRLSGQIVR